MLFVDYEKNNNSLTYNLFSVILPGSGHKTVDVWKSGFGEASSVEVVDLFACSGVTKDIELVMRTFNLC
jgi:hypothetical protein